MEELALNGGNPVRETPIFYGHQYIDDKDVEAVVSVLRSEYLTCGPKITEVERRICEVTGAKYAVAVSNGTAALHVACMAAGIGEGDEVITTPITFAASANCVRYCGGTVVFADINPKTYNIDPEDIERKITSRTKAVIAVDFAGQSVEIDRIKEICNRHKLIFIEDAAHSMGTKYNGQPIGSWAEMTTFSFHPVKTITGGEGGAITTNDEGLYRKLMLYRTHGITRELNDMKNVADGPWYYEQVELGFNYRMTDMQAALICSQMDKLELFVERRKEIVRKYDEVFERMPQIQIQEEIQQSDTARHLYIIRLKKDMLCATRLQIYEALQAENVYCNVHYIPVYYFPYYEQLGYVKGICPNAESLYEDILTIPLYYGMTDEDVQSVIDAVQKVLLYYRK